MYGVIVRQVVFRPTRNKISYTYEKKEYLTIIYCEIIPKINFFRRVVNLV